MAKFVYAVTQKLSTFDSQDFVEWLENGWMQTD